MNVRIITKRQAYREIVAGSRETYFVLARLRQWRWRHAVLKWLAPVVRRGGALGAAAMVLANAAQWAATCEMVEAHPPGETPPWWP